MTKPKTKWLFDIYDGDLHCRYCNRLTDPRSGQDKCKGDMEDLKLDIQEEIIRNRREAVREFARMLDMMDYDQVNLKIKEVAYEKIV